MYNKVWLGFVFMVIVMVIVMQLFEKLKDRLLKWTIN
jgi:NitT/TauT family transport system permease protein